MACEFTMELVLPLPVVGLELLHGHHHAAGEHPLVHVPEPALPQQVRRREVVGGHRQLLVAEGALAEPQRLKRGRGRAARRAGWSTHRRSWRAAAHATASHPQTGQRSSPPPPPPRRVNRDCDGNRDGAAEERGEDEPTTVWEVRSREGCELSALFALKRAWLQGNKPPECFLGAK